MEIEGDVANCGLLGVQSHYVEFNWVAFVVNRQDKFFVPHIFTLSSLALGGNYWLGFKDRRTMRRLDCEFDEGFYLNESN
jgi:hypothetical protein